MDKISFEVPIYRGEIILVYSNDFLKAGRKFGIHFDPDVESCYGLAHVIDSHKYLILIKKSRKKELDTLVHECLHITNFILKDKGIIVDTENDEAQAYLLGYILGQIQHFKKKK